MAQYFNDSRTGHRFRRNRVAQITNFQNLRAAHPGGSHFRLGILHNNGLNGIAHMLAGIGALFHLGQNLSPADDLQNISGLVRNGAGSSQI